MARKIRRRSKGICRARVGGATYELRAIQAHLRQDLLLGAPTLYAFLGRYIAALDAVTQAKTSGDAAAEDAALVGCARLQLDVPRDEIVALAGFLHQHTVAVHELVDEDGAPLAWDRLSDAERLDVYLDEEPLHLVQLYLRLWGEDLRERVPRGAA